MRWSDWRFSARLAWQNRTARWTMICTVLFYIAMTGVILSRLIPVGLRSGVLTLHYNVYLGIDEVRPWPWVFFSPAIMLGILLLNDVFALGLFRQDELAARTLFVITSALVLLWGVASFFTAAVNL